MPSGIADKSIEDTLARFHQSYTIVDDCWLWNKYTKYDGYGRFHINGKRDLAHRASLMLHNIPIPLGHVVRHRCPKSNKNCVNPAHLTTGTQSDNMHDRIDDGTAHIGENHPSVKLTEAQVLEIRSRNTETNAKLAKEFGVCSQLISMINTRKIWKHI